MTSCGNNICVHRGESFALNYSFSFPDGSPFIINIEVSNPYWLLSLKSGSEIRNYWLSVENKRFSLTRPLDISEMKTGPNKDSPAKYSSLSQLTTLPKTFYWNGKYVARVGDAFAVYCDKNEPGVYKYFVYDEQLDDYVPQDYTCEILAQFDTNDTKNWNSEKYYYTIQFVNGEDTNSYLMNLIDASIRDGNFENVSTREYLLHLANIHYEGDKDLDLLNNAEIYVLMAFRLDNLELKELLLTVDNMKTLVIDVDATQPITNIDYSLPMLSPSVINVIEYMQGDVL